MLGSLSLAAMVDLWPSPARARFWKSGNLEIQKFGIQKISIMNNIKIQIHVAQNVGEVWISSKTNLPASFDAIAAEPSFALSTQVEADLILPR